MSTADLDPTRTATWSVISCLVSELNKSGNIHFGDLITNIQGTAASHRENGNPKTAEVMHALSDYLAMTVRGDG